MNAWEILGVSSNATLDECKRAYRKLVLKKHPDRGGSTEEFTKIVTAYESIVSGKAVNNTARKETVTKSFVKKVIHKSLFDFYVETIQA